MTEAAHGIGLGREVTVGVEFLAGIIDHAAHPIFVKDRQFRFVVVNQAFCELVHFPREALLGKSDFDFFPRAQAEFFRAKDAEMFATGLPQHIESEPITDASGTLHTLETTKAPLRNAAGEVEFLVGIIHDISRIKAAEERLRDENEELERRVAERTAALQEAQHELMRKERLAVLGQLAGGIAHQIRNPLAVISNSATLLQRLAASRAEPELDAQVGIILEEVWKANRTITGLLDYARFRQPRPQRVALDRIVARALRTAILPDSVEVRSALEGLPEVGVDPEQVREAVGNLVQNAIEAMPEGGSLRFEGHADREWVVLRVQDSGVGISADQRRFVFQPLVTTKPLGLGLGLVTARMLIENQRGTLDFESTPGEGTVFEVRLPAADPTTPPGPEERAPVP